MQTMYQTMSEAGYKFGRWLGGGQAIFINSDGLPEVFAANKNHAGWAIAWRGTHWEFCRDGNK